MEHAFQPYPFNEYPAEEMLQRAQTWMAECDRRRTVRYFSDRPVDEALIRALIMTASTAPSGAHKQPWTFCAVANPELKKAIREAAEKEEYENYNGRMSDAWLQDLQAFGTDWQKPFLEIAPWLIIVFKTLWDNGPDGNKHKNYYVPESVGIACGMLLSAIHHAGLVALTHTPSPMNFLQEILGRPDNERPFLLIPVGYPADHCEVPVLERKTEAQVIQWYK
ncbi:MAG: nitroreductase family protein [Saprospiraceae bacterium]|nr:nitroreductase family protein [Saprospiraceae bacterium]